MGRSRSLWVRVSDLITGAPEPLQLLPGSAVGIGQRGVRAPLDHRTVEVQMGTRRMLVSPRLAVDPARGADAAADLVVFRPESLHGIGHFASLFPGDVLVVDPMASSQEASFAHPGDALRSSVQLRHEGDTLVVKATPEPEVRVRAADAGPADNALARRRHAVLARMRERLGGGSQAGDEAALARLRSVTQALGDGAHSAVLRIAPGLTPILVGDLHGRADNLLTLLSHNGYWDAIEDGSAALVILGDAVHPDAGEDLADMADSVATMDLIIELKHVFPDAVHFLPGNHDGFSRDLMKDGVAQGVLWEAHLVTTRGAAYRDALQRFYDACPLLAVSGDWAACHAGAPRTSYTLEMLEQARRHPSLEHELQWNRQKTPGHVGGYTREDVERLRKVLGLGADASFVVGHYPRSEADTVWMNAGGVAHHHVLVSSRRDRVAAIVRVDGSFVSQTYPAESLRSWWQGAAADGAPRQVCRASVRRDRDAVVADPRSLTASPGPC